MPRASIIKDKAIFLEFTSSIYSELWTPLCSIVRNEDALMYNWAKSCEFLDTRLLKIDIKGTDGNITIFEKQYDFNIYNGPSPI